MANAQGGALSYSVPSPPPPPASSGGNYPAHFLKGAAAKNPLHTCHEKHDYRLWRTNTVAHFCPSLLSSKGYQQRFVTAYLAEPSHEGAQVTDEGFIDIVAGALMLTPYSPSAPQPSSQNSSMVSPAPAPGPLGGDDMPQSSGLSIGAIAGIAVGGAVAAVMALGVLLRLCCCRSRGHHGARSARQESAPCTSLPEHSSPWEKVGRPTLCSGRARSYRMPCSQLLKKQAYTPDKIKTGACTQVSLRLCTS